MGTAIHEFSYTDIRLDVWRAIDEWPPLQSSFNKRIVCDDQLDRIEPAIGDLTAIRILPLPSTSQWILNQKLGGDYALEIMWWTPHWSIKEGEYILRELQRCMVQDVAASYLPSYKLSSERTLEFLGWSADPARLEGELPQSTSESEEPSAMQWQLAVQISEQWNPAQDRL